jgi:hypothetical protein
MGTGPIAGVYVADYLPRDLLELQRPARGCGAGSSHRARAAASRATAVSEDIVRGPPVLVPLSDLPSAASRRFRLL